MEAVSRAIGPEPHDLVEESSLVELFIKRKQIRDQIRSCTRCGLSSKCSAPVPLSGPTPSAVAVVGEAPGAQEDSSGTPFAGPSGRVLRDALRRNGLDPESIAYLNAVCCWPKRTPTLDEVLDCRPNLMDQLDLINPSHVLVLGAVAFSSWFPKLGWREYRGKWWKVQHYPERWFFSTWHPAYILRKPMATKDWEEDIRRFVDEGWLRRSKAAGLVLTEQSPLWTR